MTQGKSYSFTWRPTPSFTWKPDPPRNDGWVSMTMAGMTQIVPHLHITFTRRGLTETATILFGDIELLRKTYYRPKGEIPRLAMLLVKHHEGEIIAALDRHKLLGDRGMAEAMRFKPVPTAMVQAKEVREAMVQAKKVRNVTDWMANV